MATRFHKNLTGSGDALLVKRAALLEQASVNSLNAKITELNAKINGLRQREAGLCDLGPETRDDLKPGKGYDADNWRDQLFQVRKDIMLLEIDLEIYQGIVTEFLTDIKEESNG